jgi:DNA ligase 1
MKRFADLYDALDSTTSTLEKVEAMANYFRSTNPADAAWALFFLTGQRLKRLIPPSRLVDWTFALRDLPGWLVEESYAAVGDLAETTALLLDQGLPPEAGDSASLSEWIEGRILPLKDADAETQRAAVTQWWLNSPRREIYLLNKLLTGELRVGVSSPLVIRAIGQIAGLDPAVISHRLMGNWQPSAEFFRALLSAEATSGDLSRPYPFFLASPLEDPPESLGPVSEWLAEWKWDGIRAQLVRRGGQTFLWSRGEELITHRFPEITDAAAKLPDGTVIDGEVLAFSEGKPLLFSALQRRIGRQALTPKVLAEAPVVLMSYDLLELGGEDVRERPLVERRQKLVDLLANHAPLIVSPTIDANSWEELAKLRESSRDRAVEGMMLKRRASPYRTGRKRGDWWKWKIDPYSIDAVLIYAHPGNGRRANLFTDYTFGVWKGEELVPVAKAYSGLTDEEIAELDQWVRAHTLDRFGPVRAVDPVQVFELHFEGIAPSTRHKSGIAVRFPRIARWRKDKPASEADSVESLEELLRVT